ncbi:DUF4215 domain-containing protein [Sandaracinus amylolyticus]|nr:DUF4215 domain-containing protein [Sandaracinus amylolyticus]
MPRFVSVLLALLALTACDPDPDPGPGDDPDAGDVGSHDASPGIDAPLPPRPDAGSPVCGDGVKASSEACDDGDVDSGDGCSATCTVEDGYACPTPGEDCVPIATCGDGVRTGGEGCDDRNSDSSDGCSADCVIEAGWVCPIDGVACRAAACGDGIIAGFEECEDGDAPPEGDDGCSADCLFEDGYACETVGAPCVETECGNGMVEGTEPCDDGDNDTGDGCSPLCELEPVCSDGVCTTACGDGVVLPGEPCDDGNTRAGDGCSPTCTIEDGFTCELTEIEPPDELALAVVYRDFRGYDLPATGSVPRGHVDFQNANGTETGIVAAMLGTDRLPVYAKEGVSSATTHGRPAFDQWYHDSSMSMTVVDRIVLARQADGRYVFDDADFFPLDTRGWVDAELEPVRNGGHNFSFTSVVRYWFEYGGDEVLTFRGDDDVWVFINGRLALDLGGVHGPLSGTVTLSARASELGLVAGRIYEVVVFQAERHTSQSSYRLTLSNFTSSRTECAPICGDGIVTRFEACDDGVNDGSYGGCAPGCMALGPRCGDGATQSEQGEQCDDPPNVGGYDGCSPACQLTERCGDGVRQAEHGEQCDDGNDVDTDTCSNACLTNLG